MPFEVHVWIITIFFRCSWMFCIHLAVNIDLCNIEKNLSSFPVTEHFNTNDSLFAGCTSLRDHALRQKPKRKRQGMWLIFTLGTSQPCEMNLDFKYHLGWHMTDSRPTGWPIYHWRFTDISPTLDWYTTDTWPSWSRSKTEISTDS